MRKLGVWCSLVARDNCLQMFLKYGSKSQNYLIFLTHSELPWCEKREGLKPFERSVNPLSLDTMYSYYAERHAKNVERRKSMVTA